MAPPSARLAAVVDLADLDAARAHPTHPYREYSGPFFDCGHRVLRGGPWATAPRVATPTATWDPPRRRRLLAGLRPAADPPLHGG